MQAQDIEAIAVVGDTLMFTFSETRKDRIVGKWGYVGNTAAAKSTDSVMVTGTDNVVRVVNLAFVVAITKVVPSVQVAMETANAANPDDLGNWAAGEPPPQPQPAPSPS